MARAGGRLYTGDNIAAEIFPGIGEAFKKDFPFVKEVNYTRLHRAEQQMKIIMELKAGKDVRFDVSQISSDVAPAFQAAGLLQNPLFSWKALTASLPKDWGQIPPWRIGPEGYYLACSTRTHGIIYNRVTIPKNKWPTSYDDVVAPYFKGNVIYDASLKTTGFLHDPKLRDWYIGWLKKLVANGVVLVSDQASGIEKVASGEYAVMPCANFYTYLPAVKRMGPSSPLAFTYGGYVHAETGSEMYFLKGASKSPATGQLYALWLATQGQWAMDKYAYRGWPLDPRSQSYDLAKGRYVVVCSAECLARGEEYEKLHSSLVKLPGVK